MKRIIYLSDLAHLEVYTTFKPNLVYEARSAMIKAKLRFDNLYGRIHSIQGELERYSNQSDFVPHVTEEDVMRWEFSRQINNAASRIQRGYKAH